MCAHGCGSDFGPDGTLHCGYGSLNDNYHGNYGAGGWLKKRDDVPWPDLEAKICDNCIDLWISSGKLFDERVVTGCLVCKKPWTSINDILFCFWLKNGSLNGNLLTDNKFRPLTPQEVEEAEKISDGQKLQVWACEKCASKHPLQVPHGWTETLIDDAESSA